MSWVMSTCMACTGVGLPSLSPVSLSGAPTRAMPPREKQRGRHVGITGRLYYRKRWNRREARTRMLLGEAMHGESTQALSEEQAVLPGSRQRPVTEVSGVWVRRW